MSQSQVDKLFTRFVQENDVDALAEVFDQLAPGLRKLALRLSSHADRADDLVQETFLAALAHRESYTAGRPVVAWMIGILANRARLEWRSSARVVESDRLAVRSNLEPADLAQERETHDAVEAAIRELPPKQRAALEGKLLSQRDSEELARELGISRATLRVRIHRGIRRLRKALPPSFATALLFSSSGLAATRERVLAEAARITGGRAATPVTLSPKVALVGLGISLVAITTWLVQATHGPSTESNELALREPLSATGPESNELELAKAQGQPSTTTEGPAKTETPDFAVTTPVVVRTPVIQDVSAPPPGLVVIPGGPTLIGTEVKDIEKMLVDNFAQRKFAGAYIAEIPQFTREVAEFALMVTEVTNEQFKLYIEATGKRPPEGWGTKAIQAATIVFLNEQGARRQRAREEGRPIPRRDKFDGQAWWEANWKDAEWEIPEGNEHKPVVYVDYRAAQDYARWAGLRLMTEFEYQRAVRGKTSDSYPWGPDWRVNHAVTSELASNLETRIVGSLPDGVSRDGVYDLIGNTWEWTSSPFVPFPEYRIHEFRVEAGRDATTVSATANWDANKRILVGGGYHANQFIARCTTRRGASRTQTADAQSFRCAASRVPGVDIAERIMADELDIDSRPKNQDGVVQYSPANTLAVDRWTSKALGDSGRPVPGYEVISGYDYITFTPVERVNSGDLSERVPGRVPEPIGFLSTNQRLLSPDLEPGTYTVSYRYGGKHRADHSIEGRAPHEENEEVVPLDLGLDDSKGYYLFFNDQAEVVGVVEALGFDNQFGQVESPGSAHFLHKDYTRSEEGQDGEMVTVEVHEQWLRFDANLRARGESRGFLATIAVQVEDGLDASSFRISKE